MTSTLLKFSRINAPTVHKLPNGLTIVAEQMPVEAVNLSLWINVGSAVESDAINGMAHFLEHMIFKGTERLAAGEFERQIEERGAVTNAVTSQDYTHFYITTAPRDFAELASLQMDVVCNASIPDDGFQRERLVVLEEIRRSEDNPRRRIFKRAMETAFTRLPYRRPVLGTEAVISQLQVQEMRDFYGSWYQPESITAVAVGNLPVEKLIATVAESFGHSQRLTVKGQQVTVDPEPRFTEIVRREFIDEGLQQARLVMVWRVPGLGELDNVYGLDVLAGILGHGQTSRLVRDLREERGLVNSVSVSNMTNKLQGTFYISAQCAVENLPAVEEAIAEHMGILQTELVSDKEIARVGRWVANKFIFANETPSDRAGLYGYYQSMMGDLEPALNYPNHIRSQDAIKLIKAAKQYLSPDAYGVVVFKPR
ncbi:M16 family metallopeptidase [Umezakia ovalisporum]|jgi:predicted Zn-dependent peptidase|uniref:Insulinase family protein n=1 Tax=Umezakia ovalisporum FSS-43 TaxID=2740520 RepID=A0ABT6K8M6_9CYAN|nr:pitrilysin family protein [Umezakia ovalisporum]MDH6058782.1 insulinase family protein [Umezakia ovalisporum FSS-43]MDH6069572.1 insulinase family protein [Umezakia ovalisporum CobakiLakeA]MDH6079579.1 insulinase family protein [Umezakia ovalisporum FSS-45]MDH6082862.1 insulinase family protein [Umezakia ovalisporum FSS-44]MDH6089593.1 insulinase family protein [Umezakia ovalisporum Ak1311]